jgi:rRNA maturation protein Nop10
MCVPLFGPFSVQDMERAKLMWCRHCRYSLEHTIEEACPECGRPFRRLDTSTYILSDDPWWPERRQSSVAVRCAIGYNVAAIGVVYLGACSVSAGVVLGGVALWHSARAIRGTPWLIAWKAFAAIAMVLLSPVNYFLILILMDGL